MAMVLNQVLVKHVVIVMGRVSVEQNTILGRVRTQQTCPKCDGTGQNSKNHAQLVMVKVQKIKQLN